MYETITRYIQDNWDYTIKTSDHGDETMVPLPFPYTVPCISEAYQEMYYWDTYFTNVGLLLSGRVQQAKYNVDNMLHLIDLYGRMPNGNRTYYLDRSQPPFLWRMVKDLLAYTQDMEWLRERAYPALSKEYDFWSAYRTAPQGLSFYGGDPEDEAALLNFAAVLCHRGGLAMPQEREAQLALGRNMYALAESGWDCNSRFALREQNCVQVDLNSLLYGMEQEMARFAGLLGYETEACLWQQRSAERQDRINRLLWDAQRQMFCDWDMQENAQLPLLSAAAFYPLFTGVATQEQAASMVFHLPLLECEYGLACCQASSQLYDLMWDYPNGWAPLHYVAIEGLLNYGFTQEALRLAEKYTRLVAENFAATGTLWEKYNVVTGKVSVTKESSTPPMMGWTAGVFLYCCRLLEENQ